MQWQSKWGILQQFCGPSAKYKQEHWYPMNNSSEENNPWQLNKSVEANIHIYMGMGVRKSPFTTNFYSLTPKWPLGSSHLRSIHNAPEYHICWTWLQSFKSYSGDTCILCSFWPFWPLNDLGDQVQIPPYAIPSAPNAKFCESAWFFNSYCADKGFFLILNVWPSNDIES